MYVLRCVNLYIKAGGFTTDITRAKRYKTWTAARRDWVYGWEIVAVAKP